MDVQPQKGAAECGLFALVTVSPWHVRMTLVCLCTGKHLVSCLENRILTEFPVVRKRRLASSCRTQVKLFLCQVCLKPDDGETMVFCEKCME